MKLTTLQKVLLRTMSTRAGYISTQVARNYGYSLRLLRTLVDRGLVSCNSYETDWYLTDSGHAADGWGNAAIAGEQR